MSTHQTPNYLISSNNPLTEDRGGWPKGSGGVDWKPTQSESSAITRLSALATSMCPCLMQSKRQGKKNLIVSSFRP